MEASTTSMDYIQWEQWKASIFDGIGSFRRCFLWKLRWGLLRRGASSSASPEASKNMRSLPRVSVTCPWVPLYSNCVHLLPKNVTYLYSFHWLPRASTYFTNVHAFLLSSTTKRKQIGFSTEPSKHEVSTKGNNWGASAKGGETAGTCFRHRKPPMTCIFFHYWFLSIPVNVHVFSTYCSSDTYYDRKLMC